jgi:hypothetical protein
MSVKTSDIPFMREATVPEVKKTEAASAAKTEAAPASGKLARASESGDPAVHALLAQLETARSNDDDDQVKAVTKKLAELGFE